MMEDKELQSPLNAHPYECTLSQMNGKNPMRSQAVGDIGNSSINSLPADLLLHILSFLEMPEIVRTSLLGTKWRYLWRSVSCLNFKEDWKLKVDKTTFIDRWISDHSGSKVRNLVIFFYYEVSSARLVDSWISFAIKYNVEKLVLDFHNGECPEDKWFGPRYKLPSAFGSCSSITNLTLSFCHLNMSAPIQLSSLKILRLELLNLCSDAIAYFTSGCPLLEDLTLNGCNMKSDLNIVIENKNLRSLSIEEYAKIAVSTELMICAPDLLTLKFYYGLPRANYRIKNLRSLKCACFNDIDPQFSYDTSYSAKVPMGVLCDLHFVEQLELCRCFVQVLSRSTVHSAVLLSLSSVTFLKIETELMAHELPGLFYLLQRSPNLNTLAILCSETKKREMLSNVIIDHAFIKEKLCKLEGNASSYMLQNLKHLGMYFLSGIEQEYTVEEILDKLPAENNFTRFLFQIAKELQVTHIRGFEKNELDLEFFLKELTVKLSISLQKL